MTWRSETIPTTFFFSSRIGRWRMWLAAIVEAASASSALPKTYWTGDVMTAETGVLAGSRFARMILSRMSRSEKIPVISFPLSTITAPIRSFTMVLTAASTVAVSWTVMAGREAFRRSFVMTDSSRGLTPEDNLAATGETVPDAGGLRTASRSVARYPRPIEDAVVRAVVDRRRVRVERHRGVGVLGRDAFDPDERGPGSVSEPPHAEKVVDLDAAVVRQELVERVECRAVFVEDGDAHRGGKGECRDAREVRPKRRAAHGSEDLQCVERISCIGPLERRHAHAVRGSVGHGGVCARCHGNRPVEEGRRRRKSRDARETEQTRQNVGDSPGLARRKGHVLPDQAGLVVPGLCGEGDAALLGARVVHVEIGPERSAVRATRVDGGRNHEVARREIGAPPDGVVRHVVDHRESGDGSSRGARGRDGTGFLRGRRHEPG